MLWAEALATSIERPLLSTSTPVEVDLTPRNMRDSYSEVVLPFGSSKEFFERYTNASGGIRMGKYALMLPFVCRVINLIISFVTD